MFGVEQESEEQRRDESEDVGLTGVEQNSEQQNTDGFSLFDFEQESEQQNPDESLFVVGQKSENEDSNSVSDEGGAKFFESLAEQEAEEGVKLPVMDGPLPDPNNSKK